MAEQSITDDNQSGFEMTTQGELGGSFHAPSRQALNGKRFNDR